MLLPAAHRAADSIFAGFYFAEAEFIKMSADKKDRPLNWYYLKIIIAGSNSYIVIREDTYLRTKIFYSIVDNIK